MSNAEGRKSIDFYLFKRQSAAIPSFEILLFCGSLFSQPESHMITAADFKNG